MIFEVGIYFGFLFFLLWGVKFQKTPILEKSDWLNRLNQLRGMFALEIVIGHVVRYDRSILYPFGKFMIIGVAFFFFVSAYGMTISYKRKENYLSGIFLYRKLGYMLVLAILAYVLAVIVDLFCVYDLGYAKISICTFFASTNWYIWELFIFYFIFYLVYRWIPNKKGAALSFGVLLLGIIAFKGGLNEGWYASALAFPFGALAAEMPIDFWKKKVVLGFGIILTVFGLCSLMITTNALLDMFFMRNAICIGGLILLGEVLLYYEFAKNPICEFLNKYSMEIYISQFAWLKWVENTDWSISIRICFVVVFTILSGIVIKPIGAVLCRIFNLK